MNCLCCGKPINNNESATWHNSCIKKFFGTAKMPIININENTLENLAVDAVNKGTTVPGVQKKLSLHLEKSNREARLTIVNYPTGYILKPQVKDFDSLPEAEQLVMNMADVTRISTVPHALIKENDNFAYITKRVDRIFDKFGIKMLAMEDFCQLDLRLTQDKYKGSYERCAKVIEKYSSQKNLDLTEMFIRLVFSFVTGNSDLHLKNFSLIETEEGSNIYKLSPAYDLLPVNVIMPEDTEEFALTINGKKTNIRKKDFITFADSCGISLKTAEKLISRVISMKAIYLEMIEESFLSKKLKDDFANLINNRCKILE